MKHLSLVLQVGQLERSGETVYIFLESSMYFFRDWQVILTASFLKMFVDAARDDLQARFVQARRLIIDAQQNYRDVDHCSFYSQPITTRRRISEVAYVMLEQLILQQLLFRGNLVTFVFY